MEDAGVGLGESAALGGDDDLEEGGETGNGQASPLDAVDPVGHDPEAVGATETLQSGSATWQSIPPLGEVVEIGFTQAPGQPGVGSDLLQETPEPLAGKSRLGNLTPAEGPPELVVDPPVGGVDPGGVREPQRAESPLESGALGPVVVEKGVIDVEEDSFEAVQGTTWRGR